MLKNGDVIPMRTTETRIGNTTYIVSSSFRADSRENAVSKMRRIIENEMQVQKTVSISTL